MKSKSVTAASKDEAIIQNGSTRNNPPYGGKSRVITIQAPEGLSYTLARSLGFISYGYTNKEIAAIINRTDYAVKDQVIALFNFFGVSNRVALVTEAHRSSVISVEAVDSQEECSVMVNMPNKALSASVSRKVVLFLGAVFSSFLMFGRAPEARAEDERRGQVVQLARARFRTSRNYRRKADAFINDGPHAAFVSGASAGNDPDFCEGLYVVPNVASSPDEWPLPVTFSQEASKKKFFDLNLTKLSFVFSSAALLLGLAALAYVSQGL